MPETVRFISGFFWFWILRFVLMFQIENSDCQNYIVSVSRWCMSPDSALTFYLLSVFWLLDVHICAFFYSSNRYFTITGIYTINKKFSNMNFDWRNLELWNMSSDYRKLFHWFLDFLDSGFYALFYCSKLGIPIARIISYPLLDDVCHRILRCDILHSLILQLVLSAT